MRFQSSRSSGPGGQHVNKVNTRIELWVRLSDIRGLSASAVGRLRALAGRRLTADGQLHLVAGQSRSQQANRQAVLDRLGALIEAAAVEPVPRRPTRPGRGAKLRRLKTKRHRGQIKSQRSEPTDWH
jgi:ribosome-associated protein